MELEKFLSYVKKAKITKISGSRNLTVFVSEDKKLYEIRDNNNISKGLQIRFTRPHRFTIFESELLMFLFIENKLVADYARFHKCKSGQEFISCIDKVYIKRRIDSFEFVEVN